MKNLKNEGTKLGNTQFWLILFHFKNEWYINIIIITMKKKGPNQSFLQGDQLDSFQPLIMSWGLVLA